MHAFWLAYCMACFSLLGYVLSRVFYHPVPLITSNWIFRFNSKICPLVLLMVVAVRALLTCEEQFSYLTPYEPGHGLQFVMNKFCVVSHSFNQSEKVTRNMSDYIQMEPCSESSEKNSSCSKWYLWFLIAWIPLLLSEKEWSQNARSWFVQRLGDTRENLLKHLMQCYNKTDKHFIKLLYFEWIHLFFVLTIFSHMHYLIYQYNAFKSSEVVFSNWTMQCNDTKEIFQPNDCVFSMNNSTGVIQLYEAKCLLPSHYVPDLIFSISWWIFCLSSLCSGVIVICRALCKLSFRCRWIWLYLKARPKQPHFLKTLVCKGNSDDWLLLNLMANNMHRLEYLDIIKDFFDELSRKEIPLEVFYHLEVFDQPMQAAAIQIESPSQKMQKSNS
ncbi:hypothetical protein TNIN_436441 [Trichonephila inaurata madagascariensis]|uniref:Innexin n=1 Tax=Trichonephila inaurata madagascariensis TaxID=2747483 RepID=A0A8X7CH66_9ARAC|nr:hypothetical protein TNIN_436441 [Trichonephila inaurata madagascariensis]